MYGLILRNIFLTFCLSYIISQNSNITIAEISRRLEVSDKTISRAIDWLKSNGYLDRAGGRKSGNWIIKKK